MESPVNCRENFLDAYSAIQVVVDEGKRLPVDLQAVDGATQGDPQFGVETSQVFEVLGALELDLKRFPDFPESPKMRVAGIIRVVHRSEIMQVPRRLPNPKTANVRIMPDTPERPLPDPRAIQADAPEISAEEFVDSILFENERVLAVDKPGWLVCHPSKKGPGSSLVGAAKRYLDLERMHLVSRLDRETSGIVIFAKDRGAARTLQMGVEARIVSKSYHAVLEGVLDSPRTVEARIIPDKTSEVRVKMCAHPTERDPKIRTHFEPGRDLGARTL